MKKSICVLMVFIQLVGLFSLTGCQNDKKVTVTEDKFKPQLDTNTAVELDVMGFFGNFEALDQIMADFNQLYPNVSFNYEQVSGDKMADYIDSNPDVDIFMTSNETMTPQDSKLKEKCADLSKENINLNAIENRMLSTYYIDNKLLSLPIGQNIYGIVVNKTLLEKEGISIPQDYNQFIDALKTLKDRGYNPIQGPQTKVYTELVINMAMNIIGNDSSLYNEITAGNEQAVEKLRPVMDKLDYIINNGYTDYDVNTTYPYDNYDGSIMRFFEGDVPFWVCNSEKVSGMKKRESKSEAFKESPFEYTYIYAPMGDNGAYVYSEPWYGFAVNKDSKNYKYAVEFMRFLAANDEINKMADIKGIPSVAVNKNEAKIYSDIYNVSNVAQSYVRESKIDSKLIDNFYTCINNYVSKKTTTSDEALKEFINACKK